MALRSVYIETTIVSYLVARPSRSVLLAAHQQTTKVWWANRRKEFDLFVSQVVFDEAAMGEKAMAELRLELITPLPLLAIDEEVTLLAESFIKRGPLPQKAARDAFHVALSAVHGMDFLLTWNCKHLANAEIFGRLDQIVLSHGYKPPRICTPEELMGGS